MYPIEKWIQKNKLIPVGIGLQSNETRHHFIPQQRPGKQNKANKHTQKKPKIKN